jgi:hypothetical protein
LRLPSVTHVSPPGQSPSARHFCAVVVLQWPVLCVDALNAAQHDVGSVVEVVEVVVTVVVVVVGTAIGAHNIFAVEGVTLRVPNWSLTLTTGRVVFGHFSL